MRKSWASALVLTSLLVLGTVSGAWAKHVGSNGGSHQSGSNRGDVWLDNAGQPAGPGHEMDPHLTCDDINIWGNKMAFSSGTFTINGWKPTGNGAADDSDTWYYDQSQGGDQIIATVDVAPLIQHAEANGERAKNKQGFHFKLQLSQNPSKHKTFWVACQNGSF